MVSVCDNGDERGGLGVGETGPQHTNTQSTVTATVVVVGAAEWRAWACVQAAMHRVQAYSRQSRDGARAGCGAPGKLPGRVVLAARDSNKDEKKNKQKNISEEVRVSGFHSFAYLCHFSLYLVNTCTRAQVDGKDILHCWRNLVTCELLHSFLFGSTIAVRTKYEVPLVYVDDRW